jgi:hypothetical protein
LIAPKGKATRERHRGLITSRRLLRIDAAIGNTPRRSGFIQLGISALLPAGTCAPMNNKIVIGDLGHIRA